jgi:hypothetical protein
VHSLQSSRAKYLNESRPTALPAVYLLRARSYAEHLREAPLSHGDEPRLAHASGRIGHRAPVEIHTRSISIATENQQWGLGSTGGVGGV